MTGADEAEILRLRAQMRAQRAALSIQRQQEAARDAAARILSLPEYRNARCVMAYAAARGELSLEAVLRDVLASGRTLAMPLCVGPGLIEAREVRSLSQLCPGRYGICAPDGACTAIDPAALELILVPGTAFDRRGGRIGQGGGYYDRFLPRTAAWRVGVCHDFALLAMLPQRAHDARMDCVVTPQSILRMGAQPTG